MSRNFVSLAVVLISLSIAGAQQPNAATATLEIDDQAGPPYPITNVFVHGGTTVSMEIRGGANVQFLVAQAPSLSFTSSPLLGGQIDLDLSSPAQIVLLMDGFSTAPWEFKTDSLGTYRRHFAVPPQVPQYLQAAFQAVVQNPASAYGVELSAATSILTMPGIQPLSYSLGDDGCAYTDLVSQYGIAVPFYSATYTGCWVCANGFVSFGGGSTDFTPTDNEMHAQLPRIAPFWSDLDPTVPGSGSITLEVDQIDPLNPVLTFTWSQIPDWPIGVNGGLGWHTFGTRIDVASGDIEIHQYPSNADSNYDIMIGISRGISLDPTGPGSMDISAQFAQGPYIGQTDEGMYEGFTGSTSITFAFPQQRTFDLAGNFWRYSAIGAGSPGAHYAMDFYLPLDPNDP